MTGRFSIPLEDKYEIITSNLDSEDSKMIISKDNHIELKLKETN